MRSKLIAGICALTILFPFQGYPDNPPLSNNTLPSPQILSNALFKIGVSTGDIGELFMSGNPPPPLMKTFNSYANDSNSFKFQSLTFSERNALIIFAFKLQAKGALSETTLHTLMTNEKVRAGMPKAHIKEVYDLNKIITENPNYVLSPQGAVIIGDAAGYINDQPFAFADILGAFVKPVLEQDPHAIALTTATEDILIKAAQTVTGLSGAQIDHLQELGNQYGATSEFANTPSNVNDLTQLTETAYYPNGANLLLPFFGADTLIYASKIHYAYPSAFNQAAIDRYRTVIARDPAVQTYYRNGIAPRYNANREENRASFARRTDVRDQRATDGERQNR